MTFHSPSLRPARALAALALATLAVAGLSACGKKDEASGAATQVAAKVDAEEISVHQINQVLSRTNTNGASPQDVQRLSRDVLEKLIDQQLLVAQATEAKLNRSPDVVAQIESAKREILARAYVQQVTSSLAKPTADEVKKYFAEHPALFAERRIFNVQEIIVPATPGLLDVLRGFAAAGKPVEEVAAFLKGKDIKFNGGAASRPAEQVPLELLGKLQPLKDGQCIVLEAPRAFTYVRLAGSQSAPIGAEAAAPRIEQFLTNQRATEAVAASVKQLRTSAKISYQGEFAKPLDGAAATPATAATPAPAATPDKPSDDKAAMDKGVKGLK
jgi:EpsD family peptidyl-prolyl cis-trans isomerase